MFSLKNVKWLNFTICFYPPSGCRIPTKPNSLNFPLNPFDDDKNGVNPQHSLTPVKRIRSEEFYSTSNILWEGNDFKHCTWFIYPKNASSVIKVQFNYFDIYSEIDKCGDVLEINNVKFCGNQDDIEMTQYFTGYPLKVQFRVYGKSNRKHRGFELEWKECDYGKCPEIY